MNDFKTVVVVLLICSCMGILFVCALAFQRWSSSKATAFSLVFCGICVVIYDFGYAMEIYSTTLHDVMFWVRFEHWGIQLIPVFWLMFTLCLLGKRKFLTLRVGLLLMVLPLAALACSQTLGGLNLLHPNPRLAEGEVLSLFTYDRGWAMYLVTAFQSLYLAASGILFTVGLIRGSPLPRKQIIIYWIGSLIPWLSSLAFNCGLTPYNTDTTPLVLSLSVTLFMFGFLKEEKLDLKP